jgi:hypothetical protein
MPTEVFFQKLFECFLKHGMFLNVEQTGIVYAVEFSHRSGRDLVNMAKKRTNVIPIIEDARHPMKYRMLVGMVDVIFADVAQPDQVQKQHPLSLFFFFYLLGILVFTGFWHCKFLQFLRVSSGFFCKLFV